MLDLLVVGEVAVDRLGDQSRPGGVACPAVAAGKLGLNVGVAGPLGMLPMDEASALLADLANANVDTSMVTQLQAAALTKLESGNCDAVEPQQLWIGSPLSQTPFVLPMQETQTRSILLYPVNADACEAVLTRWPDARLALELQYDPVNMTSWEKGLAKAEIVFASWQEALRWTKSDSLGAAAEHLLKYGPKVVVFRFGQGGSAIYRQGGEPIPIPAYRRNYRCTVGAGNFYDAVFLASHLRGESLERCGKLASYLAGRFTESFLPFATPWDVSDQDLREHPQCYLHPDTAAGLTIYLAGPFFNQDEFDLLERVRRCLEFYRFRVFSPLHETGPLEEAASMQRRRQVFDIDLGGIHQAALVVAITDGDDTGTAWECGYAHAIGKDVVLLRTDVRTRPNLMLEQGAQAEFATLRQLVDYLFSRFNELPSM